MSIDEVLEKRSKKELYNVIKKNFEDTFNPQHYYCWLMDLGFTKKRAREIEKIYEENTYRKIMEDLKYVENS